MTSLRALNISRSDLWIVTSARSNVLIEGPEAVTDRVVTILAGELRAPLGEWSGKPPDPGGLG